MADFLAVPLVDGDQVEGRGGGFTLVLFEAAESDLVALHGGAPDVQEVVATAAGRLEAIGVAAEQVYRSLRDRLQPDAVEMEIAVGLSAEVGWFVAKSAASGSVKLTLKWTAEPQETPKPQAVGS